MTSTRPPAWNGPDGMHWAANHLRYEAMLGPLTPHLLAAAAPAAGEHVLDVGCGCGATTRLAAVTAADVLGVDLSAPMLEVARRQTADAGLTNVRYAEADAQTTRFEPVDVVMSQFGVMFFDDPAAAFANLRQAGRRLAFLCWQGLEENEGRRLVRDAISPYVDMPPPQKGGALSFADPDYVRELLTGAGFRDVELRDVREPIIAGRDADDATEFQLRAPAFAGWFAEAGPDAAARATEALRAAYAERETPDGVVFGSAAWLVTAR
jgi:SAM-dependent methyltransferase